MEAELIMVATLGSMGSPRRGGEHLPPHPIHPYHSPVQCRHVKYGRVATSEPFGPIRSDSFDSRINLRLIAHRKDDIEQTQRRI